MDVYEKVEMWRVYSRYEVKMFCRGMRRKNLDSSMDETKMASRKDMEFSVTSETSPSEGTTCADNTVISETNTFMSNTVYETVDSPTLMQAKDSPVYPSLVEGRDCPMYPTLLESSPHCYVSPSPADTGFVVSPLKKLKLSPIPHFNGKENDRSCSMHFYEKPHLPPARALKGRGQLKLAVYFNHGLLTVHAIQARHLSSKWKNTCDAYIKMSLIPEESKRTKCRTGVIQDSNHPLFDEKFSFEILEEDVKKRLFLSVWHKDREAGRSEFLGCMSFGVKHLLSKKNVSGWYYLLTEEVGRRKHLLAFAKRLHLKERVHSSNIPEVNKDVLWMDSFTIVVKRGRFGFGFTLTGTSPVRVGRVEPGSPAVAAGLQQGDYIVKINGQNVSRSTADSVAKIVKHSTKQIVLDVQRPRQAEVMEQSSRQPAGSIISRDDSLQEVLNTEEECKENGVDVGRRRPTRGITTAPPQLTLSYQDLSPTERGRQDAIDRLLSCEEQYIRTMQFGIQRYSRPLRHCILSPQEHATLFQNVEKLVAISEYHIRQLKDNSVGYSDRDDPADRFVDTVGGVYQSKVAVLCEAYESYCNGSRNAVRLLSELREYNEFEQFLSEPPIECGQPTIVAFIQKPQEHIKELLHLLQVVHVDTSEQHHDCEDLTQVVDAIQCSWNRINENNTRRSRSTNSVTSSGQSKCSTQSLNSVASMDSEVLDIQSRLLFARNVPTFQLAVPNRHLIYCGELLQVEGRRWVQLQVLLFSDILLLTKPEADGTMTVVEEPIYLQDILGCEFTCSHPSEFVINSNGCPGDWDPRVLTLRAPSIEQKCTWKNILEQRISACRMHREGLHRVGSVLI